MFRLWYETIIKRNSVTSVSMGSWNNFYQAIRHCNIFLKT